MSQRAGRLRAAVRVCAWVAREVRALGKGSGEWRKKSRIGRQKRGFWLPIHRGIDTYKWEQLPFTVNSKYLVVVTKGRYQAGQRVPGCGRERRGVGWASQAGEARKEPARSDMLYCLCGEKLALLLGLAKSSLRASSCRDHIFSPLQTGSQDSSSPPQGGGV
jgi:hypothetical protein